MSGEIKGNMHLMSDITQSVDKAGEKLDFIR